MVETYRNQSTAMIRVMSSVGRPTDVSTITMVTRPACGIPAAPILAAVAVILKGKVQKMQIERNLNCLKVLHCNETVTKLSLY